uniref:Uncharacterized protein n=1 Tax=Arundo donax TaxID=35708 RepID=A0A0A9GLV6_ARUDO
MNKFLSQTINLCSQHSYLLLFTRFFLGQLFHERCSLCRLFFPKSTKLLNFTTKLHNFIS